MRRIWLAAVFGVIVGLLALPASRAVAGDAGQQKSATMERTIKVTMKYLLYLPKDYEQKPSWPLMLFLHGSGERGDDLQPSQEARPAQTDRGWEGVPVHRRFAAMPQGRMVGADGSKGTARRDCREVQGR